MQFPVIHLNGTDAQSLFDGYVKAMNAASALIDALGAAAPNRRDYYPLGADASTKAQAEHIARAKMADTIYRELQALAIHVQEQGGL